MRVLLMTLGTRGDVQPFVALGQALVTAGHHVVLCGPHRFSAFVLEAGVPFAGVDDGPLRQLDSPADAGRVIAGGLLARLQQVREMPTMFDQLLDDCWQVASGGAGSGADVIVHNGQILAGQHLAERLDVPAVLALPIPLYVPTREFPWAGQAPPAWWPRALNKATYRGMRVPALVFGKVLDRWRRDTLGLAPRRGRHDPTVRPDGGPAPILHAYSPAFLARPGDWPASATVTGYWFLNPSAGLPEDVKKFLAAGPAPVFAGFGSMTGLDPAGLAVAVVEAAAATDSRLILDAGWGGLDRDAAMTAASRSGVELCVIANVDYRLLFPQMSVVVHHGGAGTTGTAVAAGRPQVICPFVADQPFWARIAQQRGVAPDPIPQRRLTASELATRLTWAFGDPPVAAAAELGERVAAEEGRGLAVEEITRVATR